MANEWEVPRAAGACAAGDRTFEPGELFAAYLFRTAEGYARREYCLTCVPPDAALAVGTWRTRLPPPTPPRTPTFDRAGVLALFQQLESSDHPEQIQLRFVLALLLWRRKALRFVEAQAAPSGEVWRFTATGGDATHVVRRPELDESELERLSAQLEGVLAGATPPPAALARAAEDAHAG